MKIVEPSMIDTDFGDRSFDFNNDGEIADYQPVVQKLMAGFAAGGAGSAPSVVAAIIFQAAIDGTDQLRCIAGEDAKALFGKRKAEDDRTFIGNSAASSSSTSDAREGRRSVRRQRGLRMVRDVLQFRERGTIAGMN